MAIAQNHTAKWYFGNNAGLDFMTNPPSVLTGSMNVVEGCASISDAAGNLLFYTDGMSVWNQNHAIMANGTGLLGSGTTCQSSVILKKQGSASQYYIFTLKGQGLSNGLNYSEVDMTLSAGQGSVISLNQPVYNASCTEALVATRHCNGVDYWVVVHEKDNSNFRAYLVTTSGISATVVSSVGSQHNCVGVYGTMKFSPNGQKLGVCNYCGSIELFDFDNTTGTISNPIQLGNWGSSYGIEFSSDGSKLYSGSINSVLFQWDLCAGSNSFVSVPSYSVSSISVLKTLQLAKNGKIYCAVGPGALCVINNPNALGASCGYSYVSQSIAPNAGSSGLPNFVSGFLIQHPLLQNFTYSLSNSPSCFTGSFSIPPLGPGGSLPNCSASGFSVVNYVWDFGDPVSGINNNSTLSNPIHVFSNLGTFTTALIVYYSCGGGTDTLRQVIQVNQPCASINSQSITCASLGSATITSPVNSGPYSYTWMPSNQTSSIATGLTPGVYTVSVKNLTNNLTYTLSHTFTPLVPLTGSFLHDNSITCHGANTGTAAVINLAGGSGNQYYLWTNGINSYTTTNPNNLGAGFWNATVTDALTGCTISAMFIITQPPAQNPVITISSASACVGTGISFTATNSGGTPGTNPAYTYTWVAPIAIGASTDTFTSTQNTAGNYVYTVQSSDGNNCVVSQTVAVDFVPNPTLSVSNISICPLETGTLNVSGANSYTWSASTTFSTTGASFTQSPLVSTQYTVLGEALSCTSMATASLTVKPLPNPFISHNSPACENSNLLFSVSAGTLAVWSGPSTFASASINNTLSNVQLNQSGLYEVTVTAANSCTASVSASLTVKPLPQFSIAPASSSICANTTSVSLTVLASSPALTYTWLPNTNLSTNSGTITDAYPATTIVYTVVGSLNGCTNAAQSTVNVVPPPSLSAQLNSSTLCSQAFNGSPNTITLTAGGASTYSLVTVPDMFNANPAGPVSPLTAIPPYTGIGSATLSGSNGVCTVTTSLTFSILPNPSITVNNYTPVICAGESFTYTNQGANTYTWSSATPNFTSYSNGGVAVAHPSINSVFSVFGGSLGCNSALHTSSITVNPLPTVNISPDPLKLCLSSTAELFANSNATDFIWLPAYGLNSYTTQLVSTHINQNQNYTVVATLNNCSNTAVAMVSVMPLPNPVIVAVKNEVCLYEQIHLKAQGGVYYEWKAPNAQTYTVQNLQLNISHMNLAGLFTLKVVDVNGCANYSTQPVVVHDLPGGYLYPQENEFCVPHCTGFEFKANPASQNITAANWSMDGKLYSSDNFTVCFSKDKSYTISGPISNEFNCKNTVSVSVIGRPKPVAEFYTTPENPIEGLDEVSFVNVTSNIIGYSWQSAGAAGPEASSALLQDWQDFKSEAETPSYMFEEAGVYGLMLMVKNEFNCVDTVMKTIVVESDFAAYIPNAFTPNGDGLNDVFYPVLRGVKTFDLQIYDRWGELIFASNSSEKVWDGTFKGQECKQDVYNYKLVLLNVRAEEKVYTGSISLYK